MTNINAGVPTEWVPRFIGHRIWARPAAKPGAIAEWVELLDVWEEETTDPAYPYRFHAWIWWKGKAWSALLPQQVYIEGVPESECTKQVFDRDGEKVPWWTWTQPFDDPPEWPRHPTGWEPEQPADKLEEFPTVESDIGDQFALFDT